MDKLQSLKEVIELRIQIKQEVLSELNKSEKELMTQTLFAQINTLEEVIISIDKLKELK